VFCVFYISDGVMSFVGGECFRVDVGYQYFPIALKLFLVLVVFLVLGLY